MGFLSLLVKIGGDNTGFQRALDKSQASATSMARNIGSKLAAAFSIATIGAGMKKVVEFGGRITDLSNRLGVSTKTLQEFDYAAKQSGSDVEMVAKAFRALSDARLEALKGNKETMSIFNALGISESDIKGDVESLFRKVGQAFETTDFGGADLSLASKLLGKGGPEMLQVFKDGFSGLVSEAQNLGIAIDDGTIKKLDEVGDSIDRITAQLNGPMAEATLGILTVINSIVQAVRGWGASLGGIVAFVEGVMSGQGFSKSLQNAQKGIEDTMVDMFVKPVGPGPKLRERRSIDDVLDFVGGAEKEKAAKLIKPHEALNLGSQASQGLFLGSSDALKKVAEKQFGELVKIRTALERIANAPNGQSTSSKLNKVFT